MKPAPDEQMTEAWQRFREAELGDRDERLKDEDDLLARHVTTSVAGVIAKLRAALYANVSDPRIEGAVLCNAPLSQAEGIRREALHRQDYPNECIWAAIVSLERMEGGA